MNAKSKSISVEGMSEMSEKRLWKALDDISTRLKGIELQLSDVVRLEERMHNHDDAIMRYGKRLDNHDSRVRGLEIWQANHGDRSSNEKQLDDLEIEVKSIKTELGMSRVSGARESGQKDVVKIILKWAVSILGAIVIYYYTRD